MSVQLELDLWRQLAVAEAEPEHVDVERLCLGLDDLMAQVPPREQLAMAGVAFFQIADVFARRADVLLKDWQQTHQEEGPVLELVELDGLVRQSMVLGLDELIAEPEPVTRRSLPHDDMESVAAVVEKSVLLDALEPEGQDPVMEVSEEESVTAWVAAISRVLADEGGAVSFRRLLRRVGLSGGRVFLGLLLGGFELRVEGEGFYGGGLIGEGCELYCCNTWDAIELTVKPKYKASKTLS